LIVPGKVTMRGDWDPNYKASEDISIFQLWIVVCSPIYGFWLHLWYFHILPFRMYKNPNAPSIWSICIKADIQYKVCVSI